MAGQVRLFTKEEIEFLEQNYNKMHYKDISKILERHPKVIHRKLMNLGLRPCGPNTFWTEEEFEYLKNNLTDMRSVEGIAKHLGRSTQAIHSKIREQQLNIKDHKTLWSTEDLNYLEDKWGISTVKTIAKNLNRSELAIMRKACEIGLGKRVGNGYCVDDIYQMLGVGRSTVIAWIRKGWLKGKKNKTTKRGTYVVSENDLKDFLFTHQERWDTRKWNVNIFMKNEKNPEWLDKKIEQDKKRLSKSKTVYSNAEDKTLLKLFFEGKSFDEISKIVGRTEKSVRMRLHRIDYGIKDKGRKHEKNSTL